MGFAEALTLIFVVLKLVGTITWPWIWVLAPLWIGYGVFFLFFLIILFIASVV
jgi:hypothetical protein